LEALGLVKAHFYFEKFNIVLEIDWVKIPAQVLNEEKLDFSICFSKITM
jgi:hypothetical protein